jgi:crenactin
LSEEYKRSHVFGIDYGTSDFKYGPITIGEVPEVTENRGYFTEKNSIMSRVMGVSRDIVVGKELPLFLESREDVAERLVYPMRNGIVERNDVKAWQVTKELTRYALENFAPSDPDFRGFYVVASLAVVAPRYMYEQLFDIFGELNTERMLVRAATIIPQPLAVAIAHKIPTCVVVESGHGNTQVCPISMYPIRNAVLALNRGGSAANILTSEILKDTGYGDLAKEEKLVRRVKEQIGLLPRRLEEAIDFARRNPDKVKREIRIEGTRIKIDLGDESWTRFLIGEYVFNPGHEIFQSYFKRGMPRPSDVKIGDTYFYGMTDMAEAIIQAVEKCSIELQPHLYSKIILSGGNFNWNTPRGLEGVAVTSDEKIRIMLKEKGIENIQATVAREPTYSVWRGCIVYGYAVPYDFKWRWERMEGWLNYA